ncbi:MAG: hypothetical protein BMS9Abin28_1863 [Anaerolineae bacterium]|nr:MAG: hypothetical protein BMS9Abin28_1863 [Anaerolineae bacterium]
MLAKVHAAAVVGLEGSPRHVRGMLPMAALARKQEIKGQEHAKRTLEVAAITYSCRGRQPGAFRLPIDTLGISGSR